MLCYVIYSYHDQFYVMRYIVMTNIGIMVNVMAGDI